MISRYFPAWYLGRFPRRNIILASYGASLANSWAAKARDLLGSHGRDVFGVGLGTKARASWTTSHGGELNSSGVGGATTGKGAHLLIIDDPTKNAKEAFSRRYKEAGRDWYHSVAQTRLEPNGAVILLQTRWAHDDLAGVVSEDFAHEGWHRLTLPALALEGDPLGRAPGEALFPERFPAELLRSKKRGMLPFLWAALYEQAPTSKEGKLFHVNTAKFFEPEADGWNVDGTYIPRASAQITTICDLNVKDGEENDPLVVATFAAVDHYALGRVLLVLDVLRLFVGTTQHASTVERAWRQWGADWVGIEAVAYQSALEQGLSARGFPTRPLGTGGKSKRLRALPAATHFQRGRIFLPRGAAWVPEYLAELDAFPSGRHDDQVDVTAYAARELLPPPDSVLGSPEPEPESETPPGHLGYEDAGRYSDL